MNRHKRLAAALVATALCAGCVSGPSSSPSASSSTAPATGEALASRTFEHLAEFQRIADANGGNRAHGTPGYQASVDYAEKVLKDAGYDTKQVQEEAVTESSGTVKAEFVGDKKVDLGESTPLVRSPSTPAGGVTGVVRAAANSGCDASDYAGLEKAIALVQPDGCTSGQKMLAAAKAGALAAILPSSKNPTGTILAAGDVGSPTGGVPMVGVFPDAGDRLKEAVDAGEVKVHLEVTSEFKTSKVNNLIAERPGAEGNTVLLGAHLDSVEDGPGINDNASGSALVLSLAESMASKAARLRIALWDAEETGLNGSGGYAQSLDATEVARIKSYINLDMVASTNGLIGLYGMGEALDTFKSAFAGIGSKAAETELDGMSDHIWFETLGIPNVGVFTGAGEPLTKDQAKTWGGEADKPRDPCYHKACDTYKEVDDAEVKDRLAEVAEGTQAGIAELLTKAA